MEARVAVLEQIAKQTSETLAGIRSDMASHRTEMRTDIAALRTEMRTDLGSLRTEMGALRSEQRTDYRWLLGIMLGLGGALLAVMAKGFHWLG